MNFFSAEQLTTKDINLHKEENRRAHHTDKYEHSNLIVRRGQSFDITLTFNRAYEASRDTIILQFVVGKRNQIICFILRKMILCTETLFY